MREDIRDKRTVTQHLQNISQYRPHQIRPYEEYKSLTQC